jgi:tetratricopeptide (TPR) repeat protein
MVALSSSYRLGDLSLDLGLIQSETLEKALYIAADTGLPIGRVLVLSGYCSDEELLNLIRLQTLLRENLIDMSLAQAAMVEVRGTTAKVDDALLKLGWDPTSQKNLTPLGELLVESNVITAEQLEAFLRQQLKTRLPLGRMVVSSGQTNDAFMAVALNIQIMVRQKKITRADAVSALIDARKRQSPASSPLQSKSFYEPSSRNLPKLGEMLVFCGAVTDAAMVDALETSLLSRKAVGEVLIERQLLTREELSQALEIQGKVAAGEISVQTANQLLARARGRRSGAGANKGSGTTSDTDPQSAAGDESGASGSDSALDARSHFSLVEFLKVVHCTDDDELNKSFDIAKRNAQVAKLVLLIAGSVDESILQLAESCHSMYENGKLSFEHSCTVFEYARRRNVTVEQALSELSWLKAKDAKQTLPEKKGNNKKTTNSQLITLKDVAADLIFRRDFSAARKVLEQLLIELQDGRDQRYQYCLEQMSLVCSELQDFSAAEEHLLALIELTLSAGEKTLRMANLMNMLGQIYYFQRQYQKAIDCTHTFIDICAHNLGATHPDVACGWQNLAMLYYTFNQLELSRQAYKTALDICTDSLGPQHPNTLGLASKLTAISVNSHEYPSASPTGPQDWNHEKARKNTLAATEAAKESDSKGTKEKESAGGAETTALSSLRKAAAKNAPQTPGAKPKRTIIDDDEVPPEMGAITGNWRTISLTERLHPDA